MNTSLPDCDFGELVWENGQILTRGLSCGAGSHESHRWTGFSLHEADAQLEVVGRETSMEKRGKLWDDNEFPGRAKMDSLKKDYYTELLSEFPGSILNNEVAYTSNSRDEQLVPSAEDGHRNFGQGNACYYLPRGEPQVTGPKGDQIWRSSLQKRQASHDPYMESLEGSCKIPVSTSGLPSSKMQQPEQDQNGEPDNGIGPMISCFPKLAALDKSKTQIMDASGATTNPGLSRVEKSKSTDYPNGANPFELSPIEPPNLKPFQQPVDSNPVGQEVPFVRSRAAADCQAHEPNPSYAASMVKGKQRKPHGDEESDEPVVPSSSTSSREASNYPSYSFRSKYQESEESEHPSQSFEDESRRSAGGRSAGFKRHRCAEVHSLSEKRRRDKINKKMRLLQELVPNCKKGDKISILDEAIDYLKILQLQVQIMSMGSGLCMPPVMTPAALQHIQAAHLPHFSPMGMGMGVRMGMGMGMGLGLGCRPEQFPSPHILRAGALSGIAGTALPAHQMLGHPGQVLPMSLSSAPFVPLHAGSLTQSVLVPSLPNDVHKVENSSSSRSLN